jgi:5'-AMP-activated protein kinase catalytic alpha subunit
MNKHLIRSNLMTEKVSREIRLLKLFRHPNIIRVYELVNSPGNFYLVMEYVSGGDICSLLERKGKIGEQEVRGYFHQIVAGIEYCHRHRVTHRDIKPENLLLDEEDNVKIADFGLVNLMKDGEFCKTSCGSPNYAAPEVINGNKYCGPEVDVWSIGVVTFALLAGVLPFDEPSIPALFAKIRSASYKFPRHFSPLARDLIERMLNPDPVARINLSQVKEHPWYLLDLPLYIVAAELCSPALPEVSIFKTDRDLSDIDEEVFSKCLGLDTFKHRHSEAHEFHQKLLDHKDGPFVASYEILLVEKYRQVKQSMSECPVFLTQPLFKPKNSSSKPLELTSPQVSFSDLDTSMSLETLELQHSVQPRDWSFGFHLEKQITEILQGMTSCFKVLRLEWRPVGDLHLRVRAKLGNTTLKFDVMIYRSDTAFVLDCLYRSGGVLVFLDVSAKLQRSLV